MKTNLTLTATPQMMLNRKYYQVSKTEIEFHMIDIMYMVLHMRAHTKKDDIFMQRRPGQILTCILEWGQGPCKKSKPYPAQAYTTLVVLVSLKSSLLLFELNAHKMI